MWYKFLSKNKMFNDSVVIKDRDREGVNLAFSDTFFGAEGAENFNFWNFF